MNAAKKALHLYLRDLCLDGYSRFHKLDHTQEQRLVGLFLNTLNSYDRFDFIGESGNLDSIGDNLVNMLINPRLTLGDEVNNKDYFVISLVEAAIAYYEDRLDIMLQEMADEIEQDKDEEQ